MDVIVGTIGTRREAHATHSGCLCIERTRSERLCVVLLSDSGCNLKISEVWFHCE